MSASGSGTPPLCVVAGAGPGVGQAVARRFGRGGFALALLSRRAATTEPALQALRASGVRAEGFEVDLGRADDVARAFDRIRSAMGEARVLVYNAAHLRAAPAMQTPPADLADDLALGVTGAVACAQQVWPAMWASRGGTLLFTGGGLALAPQFGAGVASLAAAKAALRAWVIALHAELAGTGIRVGTVTIAGTVAPGTAFDPDRVAEAYWKLHADASGPVEKVFRGHDHEENRA